MMIDVSILDKVRMLPPAKQQEVTDFVEFLIRQNADRPRQLRMKGLCAETGAQITAEDIDEARREMWGSFPREDV